MRRRYGIMTPSMPNRSVTSDMGGPDMAPHTPRRSEHPGEAGALLDPPDARSTPAKPARSSIPPTLGAPRRSRRAPRSSDRLRAASGQIGDAWSHFLDQEL